MKERLAKGEAQTLHAKKRAFFRFGISLTDDELEELKSLIGTSKKPNRFAFLRRVSNTRTFWGGRFQGRAMAVLYDNSRGTIVTVMPLHWEEHAGRLASACDAIQQLVSVAKSDIVAKEAADKVIKVLLSLKGYEIIEGEEDRDPFRVNMYGRGALEHIGIFEAAEAGKTP